MASGVGKKQTNYRATRMTKFRRIWVKVARHCPENVFAQKVLPLS